MFVEQPPKSKLLIWDLMNGGVFKAQCNPPEIDDEKGVNWGRAKVAGMSHPRYAFLNGEPRIIRFTLEFYRARQGDDGYVKRQCDWLRSLEYPKHAATILEHTAPVCALIIGKLINTLVIFPSIKPVYFGQFNPDTLLPYEAKVECVAEEWVRESVDALTVRAGRK